MNIKKIENRIQDVEDIKTLLQQQDRPPLLAVIREEECIGCTKCIQVCPVDAIMGAAKLMHTVLHEECIGCELCLTPCPVDCIDMMPLSSRDEIAQQKKLNHAIERFKSRSERVNDTPQISQTTAEPSILERRKLAVKEAVERVRARKFHIS